MTSGVLIVGAGQGGFQLAASLRERGYDRPIRLVGDEADPPYNRPPLSKAFLEGDDPPDGLALRPAPFYADHGIELVTGEPIVALDRCAQRGYGKSGAAYDYDHCVLATGARNRRLDVPGAGLSGVFTLRDTVEAQALRATLGGASRVVVVGGGFIGLEVAAVARAIGCSVDVVEATMAPMGRVVSAEIAAAAVRHHAAMGVRLHLGQTVNQIDGDAVVREVVLSGGATLPADLVLVAIGVLPNVALAAAAGLAISNGVVLEATLVTGDPDVSALGDCASFPDPFGTAMIRLESVQNAVDHARCIAARLTGNAAPYSALPWFWSEQGDWKLQIAGYGEGCTTSLTRPEADTGAVFRFRDGVLRAVESVNSPVDHVLARRILAHHRHIGEARVLAAGLDLRRLAASLA